MLNITQRYVAVHYYCKVQFWSFVPCWELVINLAWVSFQRFAAVIMRIREPKTTALIFASGKMVSSGFPTKIDFIDHFICCFQSCVCGWSGFILLLLIILFAEFWEGMRAFSAIIFFSLLWGSAYSGFRWKEKFELDNN